MIIYPKVKKYIKEHYVDGKWLGTHVKGKPVITIDGVQYPLDKVLKAMDYVDQTKYTEETPNEDMGELHPGRDNPVTGDGVSESEE